MRRARTKNDLRCFCAREPLLAVYGLDENGKLYVHMKVWKQKRVYGEILVTGGTIKLRCRECNRWNTVVFRSGDIAQLVASDPPLDDRVRTASQS